VPGAQGLVLGVAAAAGGAATAPAFQVIKHGGFARFSRETPCAPSGSRKDANAHVSDRQPRKATGLCRLPPARAISAGRGRRVHLQRVRAGRRRSSSGVGRECPGVTGSSAETLAKRMRLRTMSAARGPGSIGSF
jgi:hypothetical protein